MRRSRAGVTELEQGGHSLHAVSLVIHELSDGIQRFADGRRKEHFHIVPSRPDLSTVVLPMDGSAVS